MNLAALIPAFALCAICTAAVAVEVAPFPGTYPQSQSTPSMAEPNRLDRGRAGAIIVPDVQRGQLVPFLGLAPFRETPRAARRRSDPGFLNADPFDPNSVVNSFDRNMYANPYPYDPYYNPYGQAPSNYAPRGGSSVPMGNGIPYGR